ncbi:acylphosphatase [Microbulbifer sp. JTAC008]|uniref:acylphosphatase n=1 Tax=Microbulbifer sp. JTAC008 TaxID=3243374 RepID=UPI00403954EC
MTQIVENVNAKQSPSFSLDNLLKSDLFERENSYLDSKYFGMKGEINQLLITETAKDMGMQVDYYSKDLYKITYQGKYVLFCGNSALVSEAYRACAQQKHLTKDLLARNGVPVAAGRVFDDIKAATDYFSTLHYPVVIKPVTGSHGRGITTGITSVDALQDAWKTASAKSNKIIIERHISGCDLRVNVIGGCAVSACLRIAPNVIGDGTHNINELISEKKNSKSKRNPKYRVDSEYILRTELLDVNGISREYVPAEGERIWLAGVANISAGGESIQLLDRLDTEVIQVAERAANAFPGIYYVGVDIIVPDNSSETASSPYVIEVNTNSATSTPVFPDFGKPIDLPRLLLEYLFSASGPARTIQHAEKGQYCPELHPIRLAAPWNYPFYTPRFRNRQNSLISLAAYKYDLKPYNISTSISGIVYGDKHVLFHQSTPDVVPQVARRACLNRVLRNNRLNEAGINTSLTSSTHDPGKVPSRLRKFRALTIGGQVVAALERGIEPIRNYESNNIETHQQRFGEFFRDVSEILHADFASIATQSVEALFNPLIAGVDIVAEDISRPLPSQYWMVSQITCSPSLDWHYFPTYGVGRDVASALLLQLFPKLEQTIVQLQHWRIRVKGKVQGIGYRKWVQRSAFSKGIVGKVLNRPDKSVEIWAQGSHTALAALLDQCAYGPHEKPSFDIDLEPLPITEYQGFRVDHSSSAAHPGTSLKE